MSDATNYYFGTTHKVAFVKREDYDALRALHARQLAEVLERTADDHAVVVNALRAEVERLRNALDWIADPRGNNVCTPQEIAEAALGREKP